MKCGNKFVEEKPKYVKLKKANRIELILCFTKEKIKRIFTKLKNKTLFRDYTLIPNYIMTEPMTTLSIEYDGKVSKNEISMNYKRIINLTSLHITLYLLNYYPNFTDISYLECLDECTVKSLKILSIDFDYPFFNEEESENEKVFLDVRLYDVLSKFEGLTSLSLDMFFLECNYRIINELSKTIKSLVNLQNLELELNYDYEIPIFWDFDLEKLFDAISKLRNLRSLTLGLNNDDDLEESFNVGDKFLIYFSSSLKSCTKLEKLDLNCHYISIGGISALAKCFKKLPSLSQVKLVLYDTNFDDPDGDFFNELFDSLENLKEFHFEMDGSQRFINMIFWEFKKFIKLEKLSIITEFDIYSEDDQINILEKLKQLPKLNSLELDRSYDEDLIKLFKRMDISGLINNLKRPNANR